MGLGSEAGWRAGFEGGREEVLGVWGFGMVMGMEEDLWGGGRGLDWRERERTWRFFRLGRMSASAGKVIGKVISLYGFLRNDGIISLAILLSSCDIELRLLVSVRRYM